MFSNAAIYVFLIQFIQFVHCVSFEQYFAAASDKRDVSDRPIFAHTLCREGSRNILESYPNDPWKSSEYWLDGGFGGLTNVGKRQHYALGKHLRERYAHLIGNGEYSSKNVYVESTDDDLSLMSAETNLAGLYPPVGEQVWNADLDWQPIPVHTTPNEKDYRLALSLIGCDRYIYHLMQYLSTSDRIELIKQNRTLIKYIEIKSAKKLATPLDINSLYDTLIVEQQQGKCLPPWAEMAIMPGSDFESLALSWYEDVSATSELKKFTSGFLLKEIFDHFSNKIQSTLSPDRSLWMYFAHDYTIATMLNSLGVYKLHEPPFSSCIFFELYRGNGSPYVQFFYKNSTESDIPALYIPGCGTKCELTDLYLLFDDILPEKTIKKECTLHNGESIPRMAIIDQYNQIQSTYSMAKGFNKGTY